MIAEAQRGNLHPGLRQILGCTVIVNRMIGSLRRDDEGWDVGKIGQATRRCLLLPAGNEIRPIRLRLLFRFSAPQDRCATSGQIAAGDGALIGPACTYPRGKPL
jgi:hypothetical protein